MTVVGKEDKRMIEALIKIAGSLFVGGIGLGMILICVLLITVLVKEILERIKSNT